MNFADFVISKELKPVAKIFGNLGHGWDLALEKNKGGVLQNLVVTTETGECKVAYDYEKNLYCVQIIDSRFKENKYFEFPSLEIIEHFIKVSFYLMMEN